MPPAPQGFAHICSAAAAQMMAAAQAGDFCAAFDRDVVRLRLGHCPKPANRLCSSFAAALRRRCCGAGSTNTPRRPTACAAGPYPKAANRVCCWTAAEPHASTTLCSMHAGAGLLTYES